MKKKMFAAVLVAVAAAMFGMATTASAHPTITSRCSGCHGGSAVAVTATLASTVGSNATYNVSAPSASAIAVFDGTTKLFTFTATSGQFSVATGKTYTIYAVKGPTTGSGLGSTSVSPVAAPVVDVTAPVTTSDTKASYVSAASIKLTATDNAGGSGVAHTYYILDGASQAEGTMVSTTVLGSHTLEFWSVDVAGNVESHKSAAFDVVAPPAPVVDVTAPTTTSNVKASYAGMASIMLSAVDNAGGSGVAHTYYILDGASQAEGTMVSTTVLGSHTLSFWSVDVAGNVEVATDASFEVTAAPVGMPRCTIDLLKWTSRHGHRVAHLNGTISPASVGNHAVLYVKKSGSTRWVKVATLTIKSVNAAGAAKWSYTYTYPTKARGTYKFQLRFNGMVSTMLKKAVDD